MTLKNCIEPPSYTSTAYVVAIWPLFLFDSFIKIWDTCENFLGKWFTAPPWQKISRTPMVPIVLYLVLQSVLTNVNDVTGYPEQGREGNACLLTPRPSHFQFFSSRSNFRTIYNSIGNACYAATLTSRKSSNVRTFHHPQGSYLIVQ